MLHFHSILYVGSADGTIKLLQISGKRVLQAFLHSTPVAADVADALPDIKERDEARDDDEDDDEEDGEMVMDSEGSLSVECVGFSHDARWIASGGLDKTLKIWDVMNGACRCTCLHPASVVSLAWHSSLPAIATAALDNMVRLWDARTGTLVLQLTGHTDLVTSLSLAPLWPASPSLASAASDVILSVSDDHTVRIYHVNTRSLLS